MALPDQPIRKALANPNRLAHWLINHPLRGTLERIVTSVRSPRYLFDHEWDLAIILDACRYDLGRDAASQHNLPKPEKVYSAGWSSPIWLRRTFKYAPEDSLKRTSYITANPFSAKEVPKESLLNCEEVWRYAWDEEVGTVLPRPVTDQTIRVMRSGDAERVVTHYMQPHLPPIHEQYEWAGGIQLDRGESEWKLGNTWQRIQRGELDSQEVKRAYWENIHPVLEEVELLLENADAKRVVITADHGNYLGEYGRWGHSGFNYWHSAVRNVPWWETTASDAQTHTPERYTREQTIDVDKQLEALGYR